MVIRLIAPVVTVGIASMALIGYLLWVSYGDALRDAETKTLNYAKILEARVDATMRRVDGVLAATALAVPAQAFEPNAESKFPLINASLNALVTNFPEALASRVIDANGQLRYTSGMQAKTPFRFSDRDWFQQVLSTPAGVTYISQTHIGRVAQEPSIVVARALRNENGKVVGIAVVLLALNVFQQQFETLRLGARGVVGLRRADDHTLLLRWPHLPEEVNKPLNASNPIVQGVQAGLAHFNVHTMSQTDGTQRIFGVTNGPGHPFYVVVGIARESALAQWRQQAFVVGALSVFLAAMAFWMLWRLWVSAAQKVAIQTSLLESEVHLAGVIHSAMDAIISIDSGHRVVLFNPAAQQMFGHTEAAMLGQPLDALIPAQFRAQHGDHVRSFSTQGAMDRRMGGSRQLFGLRADGTEFPVEASISRFRSHAQWHATVILRDITQRRAAEMALADSQSELARSNADLEQFAYAASHDLIEPLRSVASSVQLLQKRYGGQLDARADEFIAHAVSGATRMKTLIDDLLAFSRVASRQRQAKDISMEYAVSEAVKNLGTAIAESNAKITLDPLPHVQGHSTQITQLLQNLLANAIKFRGDKAAVVHVGARQEGAHWVFSVADQGIGIDAKHLARVFELFKRLHTREEYAGTGIGLALCKKIVERHGGRVWVESTPGQGACFYFTLPVQMLSNT